MPLCGWKITEETQSEELAFVQPTVQSNQHPFPSHSQTRIHPKVRQSRSNRKVNTPSHAAGRKHWGVGRKRGSHSSKRWNFHLHFATRTHRGQTLCKGPGELRLQIAVGGCRALNVSLQGVSRPHCLEHPFIKFAVLPQIEQNSVLKFVFGH